MEPQMRVLPWVKTGKGGEGVHKIEEWSKSYPMIYHKRGSEKITKVLPLGGRGEGVNRKQKPPLRTLW